jgi:hypothetical protein
VDAVGRATVGDRSGTDPPRCRFAPGIAAARRGPARDGETHAPAKKTGMIRNREPAHRRIDLEPAEALRLLDSVSLGRIVFTRQALPTVRPVNHVLDGGDIVIRTQEGTALTAHTQQGSGEGVVVAYEADAIDPDTHLGWSVVVTGYARLVTDPADLARVRTLVTPWTTEEGMDHAVRIRPSLVTGVLLTDTPARSATGSARPAPRTPGRSGTTARTA